MKSFKILAIALSLLIVVSTLGGCGTKKNASTDKSILTVEVFDRGTAFEEDYSLTDNEITRYINEKFGVPNNIEVRYYPIPRNQEVEKLNVLLASKEAPDIIFTYDRDAFFNYAKQGGLTDLSELISKYGDNIAKNMQGVEKYGQYNKKQLSIVNGRGNLEYKTPVTSQFMNYIRKDWLDKLGLDIPKNVDEFYQALKAFKEKDPGGIGKDNVIPFALAAVSFSDEDWMQNTLYLINAFVKPMSEKDFYTLPQIKYPGFKDGVQFLNKMYNEVLIDKDFALQNDWSKFWQNIAGGKVGFYTNNNSSNIAENMAYGSLIKNVPSARLEAIDPFVNSEGKTPKRLVIDYGPYIMVPKFSKNAEGAVKYINFTTKYENGIAIRYGFENRHYKVVDGVRVIDGMEKVGWPGNDYCMPIVDWDFKNRDTYLKSFTMLFQEPYGSLREKSAILGEVDGYIEPIFETPIESQIKNVAVLDKKFQDIMIKTIIANPDEFSALYDRLVEEYMNIGGESVMQEKIEKFDKR